MVKNKALPDSARLCCTPPSGHSLSVSLSLSLPYRLGPIKAGLTCLLSPTPFILRVPLGSCRGWTLAGKKHTTCSIHILCQEKLRERTHYMVFGFLSHPCKVQLITLEAFSRSFSNHDISLKSLKGSF